MPPLQGRNEIIWHPRQITNLAPPWSNRRPHGRSLAPLWSNLSSFEGKFTVWKKVLVTLLGLFGASSSNSAPLQWFSAPTVNWRRGIVPPLPPRYAPAPLPPLVKPCTRGSQAACGSFVKHVKAKHRSVLTDTHVKELLRLATAEYKQDLKRIAQDKECLKSH